jgi:hypothetical protein
MLEGGVSSEHGVVWFNNGAAHFGGWVDTELELRLLAIIGREALHQESTKSRASSTTEGVEDLFQC